jgi:hypothetical protein
VAARAARVLMYRARAASFTPSLRCVNPTRCCRQALESARSIVGFASSPQFRPSGAAAAASARSFAPSGAARARGAGASVCAYRLGLLGGQRTQHGGSACAGCGGGGSRRAAVRTPRHAIAALRRRRLRFAAAASDWPGCFSTHRARAAMQAAEGSRARAEAAEAAAQSALGEEAAARARLVRPSTRHAAPSLSGPGPILRLLRRGASC